jgi:hypothetical protein
MNLGSVFAVPAVLLSSLAWADSERPQVSVSVSADWNNITNISRTVPTTQHLASAYTLRKHPLNKALLSALRELGTNDTRLQLWYSIPKQAVAELKEPTATETFWDFQYMDPTVIDYFSNTSGIHHINIGAIPRWMFKVSPMDVPQDPGATFFRYTDGTTGALLKDPSGKQFAEYQSRIYQWYTQGGFIDEIGNVHKSGYHFKIDYWGILNEPDSENKLDVVQYTKIWDAVAEAIRKIDPHVRFFGPEVSGAEVEWAGYFLNPKNHAPSAPAIDFFSLHNYVVGKNEPATWQVDYFTSPNRTGPGSSSGAFIGQLRSVMKIRDELSPATEIVIDELGTANLPKLSDGWHPDVPYSTFHPLYWVAMGANWAADFITAEEFGIPLISMTQMLGYPTQSPSCTMVNWTNAKPNAHYWILKLVNSNFGPGDRLVSTLSSSQDIVALAASTMSGRKILVVNTSDRTVEVDYRGVFPRASLQIETVDETSGEHSPRVQRINGTTVKLAPFGVAVVTEIDK